MQPFNGDLGRVVSQTTFEWPCGCIAHSMDGEMIVHACSIEHDDPLDDYITASIRATQPHAAIQREYPFDSPNRGRQVLVMGETRQASGVRHHGCDQLAGVTPDLDCAYCAACSWQCRINGAWFIDVFMDAVVRPSLGDHAT